MAIWMVDEEDYAHFTPDNPRGKTPQQRVENNEYFGVFVGENLAWGQETPREVVRWWLDSPTHCRTLMDADANEVGIGVQVDPETERGYVWVMVFGRR
jgi:uncharacterized protein YkwD